MKRRSIMTKSQFMTRRKVILYIVITILTLGIVSGFANPFDPDNTIHKASYGAIIVTEDVTPTEGTPADYDLLSNLRFAAYKLHHSSYFRAETKGKTSASGFNQSVDCMRVVQNENIVFAQTVSTGAVDSAEQIYSDNGIIVYRGGGISGGKPRYNSSASGMAYDTYATKYGAIPNQLSKYIIGTAYDNERYSTSIVNSPDGGIDYNTITGVRDNNARYKSALNSSVDGTVSLGYDVPETLVRGSDGYYCFTLSLSPTRSSRFYQNEVRTRASSADNPIFSSVTITVTIDDTWTPISVRTVEKYKLNKYSMIIDCETECTETFFMVGDVEGVVPEQAFFQPYVDKIKNDPDFVPPDVPDEKDNSFMGYLGEAFGPYIGGSQTLSLRADIKSSAISAYDMYLSLDLGEDIAVRGMLGDLCFEYADNKVKLKLNDINGFIDISNAAGLLQNDAVAALVSALMPASDGEEQTDLLQSLFGELSPLEYLFANSEMLPNDDNTVMQLRFPFDLDLSAVNSELGKVSVDASIFVNEGATNKDDRTPKGIYGKLTIGDTVIEIEADVLKSTPSYPDFGELTDMTELLNVVPELAALANQKTFGLSGTINASGMDIDVNAYIDITEGLSAVKADAVLSVLGMDVSIQYAEGLIYISLGNVCVRGTAEELPELLDALSGLSGMGKYINAFKALLPTTVEDWLNVVKSLSVSEDSLDLSVKVATVPLSLSLKRGECGICGVGFDVAVNMLDISFAASGTLAISQPDKRAVTLPECQSYLTISDLAAVITDITPYLQAEALNITFSGSAAGIPLSGEVDLSVSDGIAAAGKLKALGLEVDVIYANDEAYIAIGNIKLRADESDMSKLIDPVKAFVDRFIVIPNVSADDIAEGALDAITSVTVDEDGALVIKVALSDLDLTVTANLKTGKLDIYGKDAPASISATISPTTLTSPIAAPVDRAEYISCGAFAPTIDAISDLVAQRSAAFDITVGVGKTTLAARLDLCFDGEPAMRLTQTDLPLDITLIGGTAYVQLGNIRISGTLQDVKSALQKVAGKGILESDAVAAIDRFVQDRFDLEGIAAVALSAVRGLSLDGATLVANIAYNDIFATVDIDTDLTRIAARCTVGNTLLNISLSAAEHARAIQAPEGEFVAAAELLSPLDSALEYVHAPGYSAAVYGSVLLPAEGGDERYELSADALINKTQTGADVQADITALNNTFNISLLDGTLYLAAGNIRLAAPLGDMNGLASAVRELLAALNVTADIDLPFDASDPVSIISGALGLVQSLSVSDGMIDISAAAAINGVGIDLGVRLDAAAGCATIMANAGGAVISLTAYLNTTVQKPSVLTDEQKASYSNVCDLASPVRAAARIVKAGGVSAKVSLPVGGAEYDINVCASFTDGFAMQLTQSTLGLTAVITDAEVFVALGDIRLHCAFNELPDMLNTVLPLLPEDIGSKANAAMSALDQKIDIAGIVTAALDAVRSLSVYPTLISATAVYDSYNLSVALSGDLSELTATVGKNNSLDTFTVSVTSIAPGSPQIDIPDASNYAQLSDLVAFAAPVLPLTAHKTFAATITVGLFGKAVTGELYLDFTNDFVTELTLDIAGVQVKITIMPDGDVYTLYVDIGSGSGANNILVSQPLTADAIEQILTELDKQAPGIKATAQAAVEFVRAMKLTDLIDALSLAPADQGDGFDLGAQLSLQDLNNTEGGIKLDNTQMSLVLGYSQGGVTLDISALGINVAAGFATTVTDGALSAIAATSMDIAGLPLDSLAVELAPAARRSISPRAGFTTVCDLFKYVAPIMDIVSAAADINSVVLDLGAYVLTDANKSTSVTGRAEIAFVQSQTDPAVTELSLSATMELFSGTDAATALNVTFVGSRLYLTCGNINLTLDTASDIDRIYNVLQKYLPDYISAELAKLMGIEGAEGASAFDSVSLIVERISDIIAAVADESTTTSQKAAAVVDLLFREMNSLGHYSVIKTVSDMVGASKTGNDLTLSVSIMGITLNIIPHLEATVTDGVTSYVISSVTISTNISSVYVALNVEGYSFCKVQTSSIKAPDEVNELGEPVFVSIAEFIELLDNAVNTLTAKDEDDNITFTLSEFDFVYAMYKSEMTIDEFGNEVPATDKEGRNKPLLDDSGNKVIDKTVEVHKADGATHALKVKLVPVYTTKYVPNDNGGYDPVQEVSSYRLNIEAHISLDISSLVNSRPLTLDLYVINDDAHPDGLCFLDYLEHNGYGERISIDYTSILQIAASVMDILGADDATVQKLLGDYRLDVDTSVFDSMGFDMADLRTMLNGLAGAIDSGKSALSSLGSALDLFNTAGSIDGLRDRLEDIAGHIADAAQSIKSAIEGFGLEVEEQQPQQDTDTELNGMLFRDIVNGVSLQKTENTVRATIDNEMTTGAGGDAEVTVTQTEGTIDRIYVSNLDANTNKLDTFNAVFTSGLSVDISLPEGYNKTSGKKTYSNFANIKRLIFDVMNTANLMEFEVGGGSDNITLSILSGLINISFNYSAKVSIIDQGGNAVPRYKTAAVVELYFNNVTAGAIPDCTTRLMFYDDLIYINGVRWYEDEFTKKKLFGGTEQSKEFKYMPVNVMYTMDDLADMFGGENLDPFIYNFLFYLLPISPAVNIVVTKYNLQKTIADAINKEYNPQPTIAKVFEGYTYNSETEEHEIKINLAELSGNKDLSTLSLKLRGENDKDDDTVGVLNNYIKSAVITTGFVKVIDLTLNATLKAPEVYDVTTVDENGVSHTTPQIRSSGLNDLSVTYRNTENNIVTQTYKLYGRTTFAEGDTTTDCLLKNFLPNVNWTTYSTVKSWTEYDSSGKGYYYDDLGSTSEKSSSAVL